MIGGMSEKKKEGMDYSGFVGMGIAVLCINLARQKGILIGGLPTVVIMAICGFITWGIWKLIKSGMQK